MHFGLREPVSVVSNSLFLILPWIRTSRLREWVKDTVDTIVEWLNPNFFALRFPYDAALVERVRGLQHRRWNASKKHWEVHLAHLGEVVDMLGLEDGALEDERMREALAQCRSQAGVRCVQVTLTPLKGKVQGANVPVQALDDALSYFVNGYKYSNLYKQKKWDGKRHLFSARTGAFPAGLWPRVREVLEKSGLQCELKETGVAAQEVPPLGCQTPQTQLRPYQFMAMKRALSAGSGIIQMATGGGKTLLAAHLLHKLDRPAFFFVHTLDLLYQAAAVFERQLGVEVGILGDGQARLRPLTVATVQTAAKAFEGPAAKPPKTKKASKAEDDPEEGGAAERAVELDEAARWQVRQAIEQAQVVIFDECHHVPADTFYKIAMQAKSARWRWGLSATPWRDDNNDMLLEAALGRRVSVTRCSDLIEQGFLVPPRIQLVRQAAPRGLGRRPAYHDCYRLAIVENQQRNRVIATQARRWVQAGHSVLVLVAQVAHGQRLLEHLPEAQFVFGAMETELRRQALKELEQKLRPIMIATTLADEGLDIPSLGAVILAGGGRSQTRAFQRIGRALRIAQGKPPQALVLDFLDEAPYLRDHSDARLKLYQQEPRFQIEMECDPAYV